MLIIHTPIILQSKMINLLAHSDFFLLSIIFLLCMHLFCCWSNYSTGNYTPDIILLQNYGFYLHYSAKPLLELFVIFSAHMHPVHSTVTITGHLLHSQMNLQMATS